jgi:hypothetical protein
MVESDILERLGTKKITADEGGEEVLENLKLLPLIFKGVTSENKRIKNATAKILRTVSERYPDKLYSKFDFFVKHMKGEDTILKWLAMDTIANMAKIDKKELVDALLDKYYKFLSDESMITAGHAVDCLGLIAKVKPKHQAEITKQLFRVKTIKRNDECRNILLGKVILAYSGYFEHIAKKSDVISFVQKELKNTRSGTAKKAEEFLDTVEM